MGNIHTPKTIYSNGLVMEFCVINKQMFYKLSKWNNSGSNLSLIDFAKLDDKNPNDIIKEARHKVGMGITE